MRRAFNLSIATASCMLNLHQFAPPPCRHTLEPPTEHLHPHRVRMMCYIMHVCSASSPLPCSTSGEMHSEKESCHLVDPICSGGCNVSFQPSAGNIYSRATEYSSCIWAPSSWQEVIAKSGRRKHTYQIVR